MDDVEAFLQARINVWKKKGRLEYVRLTQAEATEILKHIRATDTRLKRLAAAARKTKNSR